jgi:hypothetical protein
VSFEYDQVAWRAWLADRDQAAQVNLRREP